jgi:alcohol dehydrogenase (cytochrome c)
MRVTRALSHPRLPPRCHCRVPLETGRVTIETLTSERYSQLNEINTTNVGKLKALCTYDVGQFAAFESGLIMVDNALIGTTQFDIFSLNPATCAENWRTHEDYPPALLSANRGAAYMDGMLFRGTQDGRVLAYDFKTGRRMWATTIADPKHGESVPSAPIAWNGLVFVGNAGGDFKGGKGHMFALEQKTGKIVWEFFLAPKVEGDVIRGPLGATPLNMSTWKNAPGVPISGGGTWTSYTLDPKTGQLYVPGGNPAPDFAIGAREGENLYTDSVVVLDAKTGDYKYHFKIVPKDWHAHSRAGCRLGAPGGWEVFRLSGVRLMAEHESQTNAAQSARGRTLWPYS